MRVSLRFEALCDGIKATRDNVPSTLRGEDSELGLSAHQDTVRASGPALRRINALDSRILNPLRISIQSGRDAL